MKKPEETMYSYQEVEKVIHFMGEIVNEETAKVNRLKKLTRTLFISLIGFSALGTYLVVKNHNK